MIVYLDLDRTIFQAGQTKQIWEKIAELYPEVTAEELHDGRRSFYHMIEDLYYYDFSSQLLSLGLSPEDVYNELAASELADGRLEFPGTSELVKTLQEHEADVRVLTFGPDDYQRFKTSLCPSLRGLPVTTTLEPKRLLLEANEEECWLVDDKAIGDELPGNVSFVQVSLEGNEVSRDELWPVYTSLTQVKEFFDEVLS